MCSLWKAIGRPQVTFDDLSIDAMAADEIVSMQMAHEAQEGGSSAIGTSDASADVREVGIADRASCRLAV